MQGNNKELKQRAQSMRKLKNATPQERHLWYDFLRKLLHQFHRQVPIGGYIVDFYCPEVKLVIELDGSQHYEPEAAEYDRIRTDFLNANECTVIRFSNYDVNCHFKSVCEEIIRQIALLQKKQRNHHA